MQTRPCYLRLDEAAMITAKQLRLGRVVLGMSQKEFGAAVGVSEQTIQRLEKLPDELQGYSTTIRKIEQTLDDLGVVFVEGGAIIKKPEN